MKSKMLGALALFTLIGALFVMQSTATSTPTVDAASGSIAVLNVGTCLTTDGSVFKGDCDALDEDLQGRDVREDITEVATLYATYAFDPKTSSDEPRAILKDADLLKISITDSGRDKRTGVLIGSDSTIDLVTNNVATGLGMVINDDLGDLDHPSVGEAEIAYTDAKFDFVVRGATPDNIVDASGNHTLNLTRSGTAPLPMFLPGDFNVDDDAVVRFYGCLDTRTDDSTTTPDNDCADTGETIERLDVLTVDEDASNGEASGNLAPWLAINASVPSGANVVILAIYYQTSDMESLEGGSQYCQNDEDGIDDDGNCPTASPSDLSSDVVFTTREKENNQALQVDASSDGDVRSVHLTLGETKRFSGVYEGYLRLTDANGDGRTEESPNRQDWGMEVGNGTGSSMDDAAVLGVESGPVTITYRDSDGRRQTLRIEIDKQPPSINIDNPVDGSSGDDQSPDFAGTIEDIDSGLADKSFRLVIDNSVDPDDVNSDYVLEDFAPDADGVAGTAGRVTHIGEYTGYGNTAFGTVDPRTLYDLGRETCGDRNLCHITAEEHEDGASRGAFDDSIRLNLRDGNDDAEIRDREYGIDFQAFVLDMAGNVGFSDADPTNPRFINALGEDDSADRGHTGNKGKIHNVLGYYSAHVITLDEKDPVIIPEQSATGYYGVDADGNLIPNRSGIVIVFDGPIDPDSVSTNTFAVDLDDGSVGDIVDVNVSKNYAFLRLSDNFASDATPRVDIADGERVEDMAGNETFGKEQAAFEANDGISPNLTVTLSGGSGMGTGAEGPDRLTRNRITVHISSDEPLQSAPRVSVVCNDLQWHEGGRSNGNGEVHINEAGDRLDVDDFIANRSGAFDTTPRETDIVTTIPRASNTAAAGANYDYTCGYDEDGNKFDDDFDLTSVTSLSRPGENWEYTWQNPSGASRELQDGVLVAVAFAHDRSRFEDADGNTVQNWGSASAEFTYDSVLESPIVDGELQPAPDGQSRESRPFVLIEFHDSRTVTLDSAEVDDVEVKDQFETPDTNRFVYWPPSLSQGDHEVEVDATDAAGNEVSFSYEFEVVARGDFVIALNAGWNAISVPADPNDTAIGSVFTDPAITTVIGWDTQGWRIATRRDGVWESNERYGALNEIRAKYGYWVKSNGFVRQPVELKSGSSRDSGGTPILISIPTEPGWNFVGVVDQDGDQTEDHFDTSLKGSDDTPISAKEYLGTNYVRAYTWDATFSRFDVVRPDHTMTIGNGVWVYYPEGTGIAP